MYLGLDISTSCVGWSILNPSGLLETWGYIKFPKKNGKSIGLFRSTDILHKDLPDKLRDYVDKIDTWGVEEAVKKFQKGKSSANTIFKVLAFNFSVSYEVYKILNFEPIYIPVSTARKTVGLKIPRGLNSTSKKSKVVEWCKPRYPDIQWGLTRNNTYKDWCFDVADSLVIAEATRLTCMNKS